MIREEDADDRGLMTCVNHLTHPLQRVQTRALLVCSERIHDIRLHTVTQQRARVTHRSQADRRVVYRSEESENGSYPDPSSPSSSPSHLALYD